MAKPVAPTEPAQARLAEARIKLDNLLLSGGDTTAIRSVITTIEAEISAAADAQAADRASVEQTEQQSVAARAHEIASGAASRLASVTDGLQAPPAPWLPMDGERHVIH